MNENTYLASKLICPKCKDASIVCDEKMMQCRSCRLDFPMINQIPWIFSDPNATRLDWINRFNFYQQLLDREVAQLKLELNVNSHLELTKKRLNKIIQAKVEHRKDILKLLEPLGLSATGNVESSIAFSVKLPQSQALMSYYSNVGRDWAYGEEENQICLDLITDTLDHQLDLGEMVTLGSGAARLPYDIFRTGNCKHSIVVDINPYLTLSGQKIIDGKNLSIYEFPVAPINLDATSVKLKVKAPEPIKKNFHFLFSDAMNPNFQDASFDTLLTPWLIDIVHQDIKDYFCRFNRILKPGGRWINFGSLSFFHSENKICYSLEETLELIKLSGFEVLKWQQKEIPYLNSPYSAQNRRETVLCFCARKIADVDQPAPFNYLPSWLINRDEKIPVQDDFNQQVSIHQTLLNVFQLIDGKKSINDISLMLAGNLGLKENHVSEMLASLLGKFYEDRLKGRQF